MKVTSSSVWGSVQRGVRGRLGERRVRPKAEPGERVGGGLT